MLTFIYFILILGLIIFIHEFGHFIMAKKAGVYCYEFSLGMGPKMFSFNRKNDETVYSLRLFPIGGYVQMAGEEIELDEKIPKNKRMQAKTICQKIKIVLAGVCNNFILGLVLLLLYSFIYGSFETKPYVKDTDPNYNAYKLNIKTGDLIKKINDKKVRTVDDALIEFQLVEKGSTIKFTLEDENGIREVSVVPTKEDDSYIYGISLTDAPTKGFVNKIKYGFSKFGSIFRTMFKVVGGLFTGRISLDNLSGPVGIYSTVGEYRKTGFKNIMYLTAYISINVGFVNLIPFPAFDGYRALCLLIEKIRGKQVSPKIENTINTIGFVLLIILVVVITIKDIIKLF